MSTTDPAAVERAARAVADTEVMQHPTLGVPVFLTAEQAETVARAALAAARAGDDTTAEQPRCEHGIALADLCAAAETWAERQFGDDTTAEPYIDTDGVPWCLEHIKPTDGEPCPGCAPVPSSADDLRAEQVRHVLSSHGIEDDVFEGEGAAVGMANLIADILAVAGSGEQPGECPVCHRTDGSHKMGCHPQNRRDAERYRPDPAPVVPDSPDLRCPGCGDSRCPRPNLECGREYPVGTVLLGAQALAAAQGYEWSEVHPKMREQYVQEVHAVLAVVRPTVTAELIERVAKVLADQHDYMTWEGSSETLRDGWRQDAAEVIAVVRPDEQGGA